MPEETVHLLTQIGIYLGIMIFSYVFALIEVNMRTSKKVKVADAKVAEAEKARDEAKAAQEDAEARLAQAVATAEEQAKQSSLIRLWMDNDRSLKLELEGNSLEPQSVTPEQRKRLIAVINQIRPWIDGSRPAQPAPQSAQPRPATPPAPQARPPKPATPPAAAAVSDEPRPAANSIVGQIDSILQEQLANSPLNNRAIRLMESPDGGVTVYVGLQRYQGVDAVPDPEIQQAIRAAISVWEDKFTPGL
jgi:hypothetical protein